MAVEHESSQPVDTHHLGRKQVSLRSLLFTLLVIGVASGLAQNFPQLTAEIIAGSVVFLTTILVATRRDPLVFFLTYVNPLLAIVVLVICLISASVDNESGSWDYAGFFKGPIPTYFLAKGIFCATALFLLGKLLEHHLKRE
jgi:hypothetical protein